MRRVTRILDSVRNSNPRVFRQTWNWLEEADPGAVRLVPQSDLRSVLECDFRPMQRMILGEVPDCGRVTDQIRITANAVNRA